MSDNIPKSAWYVVQLCQQDLDMANTKHSLKFLQWTLMGFRELVKANLIQNAIKSVVLVLDEHNEAFLPRDYQEYIKIGVCINGYLVNYDKNDLICLDRRDTCCEDTEIACTVNNVWTDSWGWYNSNYWNWGYMPYNHNGQYVAGVYGKGEGFYHGGYRIDMEKGVIKFDRYVRCDYVVLEYQSNGGINEGNVFVPDICIEPLRHYVHWQRCMFSRDPAERSNMDYHRKRYQREVRRVVAKLNSMTMHTFLSIFRSSINQLPKR